MDLPTLMDRCAPEVGPTTIAAIIRTESQGNPLAIGLNGENRLARQPRDLAEAVRWARWFVARGYSVDIGLMQINAKNLARLGISIERAFDPCVNIRAGSLVLREFYQKARNAHGGTEMALHAALSAYNTGSLTKGFSNGYVKKVVERASGARPRAPATTQAALTPDPHETAPNYIEVVARYSETAVTPLTPITSRP